MSGSDHPNTPSPLPGRAKSASGAQWNSPFIIGGISEVAPRLSAPIFVRKHVGREGMLEVMLEVTALQARGPRREIEMVKTIGYLRKGHGGNSRYKTGTRPHQQSSGEVGSGETTVSYDLNRK